MQDDTLFAGMIADNISFHDEVATQDKIEAAAKQAQIHDGIVAMPTAYRTHVGDMGSALSGGQKQRLHLARALYKQPRVLILGEATNHLDVTREQQINETLQSLTITRIVIAHRPATIRAADRVLLSMQGVTRAVRLDDGEPTPARSTTDENVEAAPG